MREPWETNRVLKMRPKIAGWYYCYGCDRYIIHDNERCKVCGWRYRTKELKRETSA